jgi:hypothetical protein
MRRVLLVVIVAVAATAAVAILLVANLNRLLEANRERILTGLSRELGRAVHVERMTVGFHGGLAITLEGLRIADDPAFSGEDAVTAAETHVVLRLWPLLHRRLVVRRIAVRAPRVTVIRTARGSNVDSLGRRAEPGARPPDGPDAPAAGGPPLAVALLNVDDGVVRLVDRTGPEPRETTIAPLSVRLSDLALATPMHLALEAGIDGTVVRLDGTLGPVGDPPFAGEVPLEQRVSVRGGALEVSDLLLSGRLRREGDGSPTVSLRATAPRLRAAGTEITGLELAVVDRARVATLERVALGVFGGTVAGHGRIDHAASPPRYAIETTVRDMDVSAALAPRVPELAARFEGRLDADWSIAGNAGDEATIRRTLTGTGRAVVRHGRLAGVNVADSVLANVTGVPGLVTLVPPRVREKYPEIFATDDTRFDELTAQVRLGGERLVIESLTAAARDYALRGTGVVTFTRHADLTATLEASAALTQDIVGALKEAAALTDQSGRLAIPFRLTGVLPDVRPRPDEAFVARALQKALVGQGLERLLGGKKKRAGKGAGGEAGRQLLEQGLDKLFGR